MTLADLAHRTLTYLGDFGLAVSQVLLESPGGGRPRGCGVHHKDCVVHLKHVTKQVQQLLL